MASATDTIVQRLGPRSNGRLLTPWEFDAADFEAGWRYELLNGVVIVNPSPLRNERDPNDELGHWLRTYHEEHPKGNSLDLTLSEETINVGPHRRRVDRAIWAGLGRLPYENEVPTITVEFVSQSQRDHERDYDVKRDEYRSIGVNEYWIVDRFQSQMTVYRFQEDGVTKKVITRRRAYTTPLLPGFRVSLSRLLKLADRWKT